MSGFPCFHFLFFLSILILFCTPKLNRINHNHSGSGESIDPFVRSVSQSIHHHSGEKPCLFGLYRCTGSFDAPLLLGWLSLESFQFKHLKFLFEKHHLRLNEQFSKVFSLQKILFLEIRKFFLKTLLKTHEKNRSKNCWVLLVTQGKVTKVST